MTKGEIGPFGANPIWPVDNSTERQLARVEMGQQSYDNAAPEINLATIWRIAYEWRWLILGSVAVALAAAVIITLLTPPTYRAFATLEINPPTVQIMKDGDRGEEATYNDPQFLLTQYGLLRSRSLAERVAQELNLGSNPAFVSPEVPRPSRQEVAAGILTGNLRVEPAQGSRLVTISYTAPSPTLAAQITNSFADSFIDSNLQRRYEASSYARQFLENRIATVKTELERSERQLVAYAQQQGIINIGETGEDGGGGGDANSLTGASLVALNQALAEAITKRVAAEQRFRQSRSVGTTAEVNESTARLREQKATLDAEYQDKAAAFKADYPEMVRLRARIDSLDAAIKREEGNVAGGRSNTLQAEYQAALAEERMLQGRVNQLKGSVLNLRGRSIQYTILQREVDTNRSLYDALLQRYKEIGVAGGIGTNLVSIVDRAQVPGGPYKPNLPLNLMIGLGLGLLAGLGAAIAIEFINDTIKTPDDVRNKLHLPSLGVIPKKQGAEAFRDVLEDQTSSIAEAYYSLRTSLQFATDQGVPKSLLVTSTRPAEGKSSTTMALAQNFARLGQRVLLIDGDLRKPAFVTDEATRQGGLSRLLTTTEPLAQHVLKTDSENLWLLPCGVVPPNPAELLASARVRAVIAEATAAFDLVIVDGPPVLGLADAPLLSTVCRGTLMVVESGKTRTKAAIDALNRLRAAGGNIVGAVLTKYRHQTGGYGYNYEPYRYGAVGGREREIQLIGQGGE